MNRLGFSEDDIPEVLELLKGSPHVRVASVFSHLAASEDPQHDDFTKEQIEKFLERTKKLQAGLGYNFIRHIVNSSRHKPVP